MQFGGDLLGIILLQFHTDWDKIRRDILLQFHTDWDKIRENILLQFHTDWDKIRENILLQFHRDWDKIFYPLCAASFLYYFIIFY